MAWSDLISEPLGALIWWCCLGLVAWWWNPEARPRQVPCHVLSPPPSFPQFKKKQLGRIRWRYRVAGVARKVGKRRVGRVRHLKGYRFRKQVLQLKGFQSQRISRWWQPRGGTWLVRDYAAISRKARTKSNNPHSGAVPWSQMTPGDWSDMLAGGAGGSNRTKRRRYESMEKPETGLAAGLLSYLEKWDANNCEPNPKKKPKGSASAKKDESQLAQNLLSVLKKCLENGDSDKAVAQTLKHSLGAWTRQAAKESHKAQPTDQEKGTRIRKVSFAADTEVQEKSDRIRAQEATTYRTFGPAQKSDRDFPALPDAKAASGKISRSQHLEPGPINGVLFSEWSVPIQLTNLGLARKALEAGQKVPGNMIIAKNFAEVQELHTLWTSFTCYDALTVICDAKFGGLGGTLIKVSVKRAGSQRLRAESVHLWPLGARGQAPYVRPAMTTDIKQFQPPQKVTLRINAPDHYRRHFKETVQPDTPAAICLELAGLQVAAASTFTGGDWNREKTSRTNQLIGHLRVPPAVADKLLPPSGRRGVFITQTKVTSRAETVTWCDKHEGESHEDYHARCMALGKGLKFRSGGGKDLGYILAPGETQPHRPQVVAVQGIPKDWDADDVVRFLENVEWTQCCTLGRRNMGRSAVSWLVRGLPPASSPGGSWQYVDESQSDLVIHISKPGPRPQKHVHREAVVGPRKQFSTAPDRNPADIPIPDEEMEETAASDTAEALARSVRPRTSSFTPARPDDDILKHYIDQGWQVHDLGGVGDCGYRSLAGAMAFNEGQILTADQAERRGATLRYQAVSHLRANISEYRPFLFPDKSVGPDEPVPNHDTAIEDFLWDAAKANTWICGVTLMACARKQGMPIVIWYHHEGAWKRCTLAPSFDRAGYAKMAKNMRPVILRLQDKHYCWVQPPDKAEVPRQWLTETWIPKSEVLQGSAPKSSAKPLKSPRTPSVASHDVRSMFSVATPSVHTVASRKRPRSHDGMAKGSSGNAPPAVAKPPAESFSQVREGSPAGSDWSIATPSVHTAMESPQAKGRSRPPGRFQSKGSPNSPLKKLRRMSQAASPKPKSGPASNEDKSWLGPGDVSLQTGSVTWAQADSWLQSICKNVESCDTAHVPLGLLQRCLLAASHITRLANEAMARSEATVEVATSGCQRAPETEAKPVVEKHLWHCRLCSYSFEMVERQSTFKKKRAHMKKCHPDADPSDTSYRTTLPLIEVADLPWEDRCWSCSKCLLGLANGLPCSQRERSTAAHLEKCTKISAKENLAKLKELKLDGFRKNNRNQTGWHNATWRQKRLQETASKGHDVRFVGENETGVGKDEARIRYTCRICKRLTNNTNYFVTSKCAPRDYVRGSHWLDLRLKQPDTVLKVVQAWG